MTILAYADAVDIGLGRGRLAAEAAASLARVDIAMRSAFGRAADINEAWRSPEQANANYARYRAYLRDPKRNPWAPIALPADESVHCVGYAVDTDDTSDDQMRIWNDHGWYWTVYRDGKLVERWHLEYFRDRDNHRNDPTNQEDEMNANQQATLEATAQGVADLATNLDKISKALLNGHPSDRSTPAITTAINAAIDTRARLILTDDEGRQWDAFQELVPNVRILVAASGREAAGGRPADLDALGASIIAALGRDDAAKLAALLIAA